MPRIRTIKSEFWTDGTMIGLSFEARLFYIGTWNFTLCDHGHLPDDPMGLKLKILPADQVDPVAILNELMEAGRIVRIVAPDGRTFLHIPRFEDHQKIDTRWNSRCPACSLPTSRELTETHVSSDETHDIGATTRLGKEGKGRESKGGDASATDAPPPRRCPKHIDSNGEAPCLACKDARLEYEAWEWRQRHKPTPQPEREAECPIHPGYPHPDSPIGCPRCAEDAKAGAA